MISFAYFDLGGVVELDFSGTDKWERLKELGITDTFWDQHEEQICTNLDVDLLIPEIKSIFGTQFPEGYSLLVDGFVNKFESNRSIWPVMEKIHKKCRIGLLTNMYPRMYEEIQKRNILPPIEWEVIIDSSIEKIAKPDPRIFEIAQGRANVPPEEILFIENTKRHIEAAKKLGWQTFWYDSKNPEASSSELDKFVENLW